MKTKTIEFSYTLTRGPAGVPLVLVKTPDEPKPYPLDPGPSQTLYNHSPDGFEWGYAGSGPSQLALAILADYLGHRDILPALALNHYQEFKRRFIATAPKEGAVITSNEIDNFIYHETH